MWSKTKSFLSIRGIVAGYVALCGLVWAFNVAWRAQHSSAMLAPCGDALAALLQEHWECNSLEYDRHHGWHLRCIGEDIAVTDSIVDEKTHKYTSFFYTYLGTFKQGFCDCERPFGVACEDLE